MADKKFSATATAGPLEDTDQIGFYDADGVGAAASATMTGAGLRTGGATSSAPSDWTGYHHYQNLFVGPIPTGGSAYNSILTITAGGSGDVIGNENGIAGQMVRMTTGAGYLGTNKKSTGAAAINAVTALTEVPTDNISPLEAFDATISYDPDGGGGDPEVWPESRCIDLDVDAVSGTITSSFGATSRCRVETLGTVTKHTGFQSVGLNFGGSDGPLGAVVGFHAMANDFRITAPISGSITNYTGVQIDEPDDTNADVSGTALGLWINGGSKVFQSAHKFGVTFGTGAADHIYFASAFGSAPGLVMETSALSFVDNGAGATALTRLVGTAAEPVPVNGKLPTGAAGTAAMQWLTVFVGTNVYCVPMYAYA